MSTRRDIIAVAVNVVLVRVGDEHNGPAQDIQAIRQAAVEHLEGISVFVRERNNLGRAGAEYTVTPLNSFIMTEKQTREAVAALQLRAGEPDHH